MTFIKNKIWFISIAIIIAVMLALVVVSQTQKSSPALEEMENFQNTVTLETSLGNIKIGLYDADAPRASANFIELAQKGFYNGTIFHRVINGFMIQGGSPDGTGDGNPGYFFEDELNPETKSAQKGYIKGTVAMANLGIPNTNGSQFFIMVADYPLPHLYTIFGRVLEGQEVANAIARVQTGAEDRPLENITLYRALVESR